MSEQPVSQSETLLLDRLTLALVVGDMGTYTDEAAVDLRPSLQSKEIAPTSVEFDVSLDRAKRHIAEGEAHFFLRRGALSETKRIRGHRQRAAA